MDATIHTGDVFDTLPLIPAGSVDCVVTSPPYWNLRSYLPTDHPLKPRELGSEPSPGEFVATLLRVFRLVRAAMADHATCWLNIGDSYTHDGRGGLTGGKHVDGHARDAMGPGRARQLAGPPEGNLALIPQRLAIALQDDGWFVRSVVVWHKPAPMPTSVFGWQWQRCRVKTKAQVKGSQDSVQNGGPRSRDVKNGVYVGSAEWTDCPGCKKCKPNTVTCSRCAGAGVAVIARIEGTAFTGGSVPPCPDCGGRGRVGYVLRRGSWRPTSGWEPVLMLAKTADYFADGEPVKTPPAAATVSRDQYTRVIADPAEQYAVAHDHETVCDGANLRDVWTVAAEPQTAGLCEACGHFVENVQKTKRTCPKCAARLTKHYAAFPSALVEKCLRAGTSAHGYCAACGKPWVRVVEATGMVIDRSDWGEGAGNRTAPSGTQVEPATTRTVGWRPSCACPDPTPRPGRVFDPFTGSGRTGLTARRLGLSFVGCELNSVYADLARRLMFENMPLLGKVA